MLRAVTAWLLALAIFAPSAAHGEPNRRRVNGRAGAQSVQALPFTLSPIVEVFDGEDRVVATAAGYRQYRHQTSCVISAISGNIKCAHRAGDGHSTETDQIVIGTSTDRGVTWSDRRTEVTAFADNVNFQEIASIGQNGDRLWLVGADVNNTPLPTTRVCWTSYSDDDGATWSPKSFNVPNPGTAFTTCGGGKGIYTANNGDLLFGGYWSDVATAPRYTSGIFRSTDNGVTWAVTATLAGLAGVVQPEEPNCGRLSGSTHLCLLRYDTDPPSCTPSSACGLVYATRSTDDGVTWSTPVAVYPGRGTPSWGRLTNGVIVAANRSRGNGTYGDPAEGWRGELYYSLDGGVTWRYGGLFQHPLDGPNGPPDLAGHGYMGAALVEVDTNVLGILSSQEPGVTAFSQAGLYWRYLAWSGSDPFYRDMYRSNASLRFPVGGGAYLDYGTMSTLNNATRWVITYRWRYPYNTTDLTNPTGDQVHLSRHPAGQRHLDLRVGASQRYYVYLGQNLATNAIWTSASLTSQLTSSPWNHMTVVYDGGGATNADRIHVYHNGTNITAGGSFTGTMPAAMTAPTSAVWQIGANAGLNTARGVIDDLVIWTNVQCDDECASRLYANGSPGDYRTTILGSPQVYFDFENTYTDRMGNWGTPTVTGGMTFTQRSGAVRYGNSFADYPPWFLRTLDPPWDTLLTQRTTAGPTAFTVTPSEATGWTETGIDITNFGTPTITGSEPSSTTLVSGGTLSDPAGLFTDNGTIRVFNRDNGWLVHVINQVTPNPFQVRGTILALAFDFDTIPDPGQYNPKGLLNLLGWVQDPTDAVASGWYWCVDTTCTALGDAAPRDGRRYGAAMSVRAGQSTGNRILIDLSNRQYPRVVDVGTMTVSDVDRFLEINGSQGEFGVIATRTLQCFAAWDTGAFIDGLLAYP